MRRHHNTHILPDVRRRDSEGHLLDVVPAVHFAVVVAVAAAEVGEVPLAADADLQIQLFIFYFLQYR